MSRTATSEYQGEWAGGVALKAMTPLQKIMSLILAGGISALIVVIPYVI